MLISPRSAPKPTSNFVGILSVKLFGLSQHNAQVWNKLMLYILLPSYMLTELLMLKHGILLVPGIVFSARDIDNVMRDMCNDWC